jgi:hypothetical protein
MGEVLNTCEHRITDYSVLAGATVLSASGCDDVTITTDRGTLHLQHEQDCCESVELIDGGDDLPGIVGGVIGEFREVNCDDDGMDKFADSFTWTLYTITTTKGDVTLRWCGESNGYYGEGVDVYWVPQ